MTWKVLLIGLGNIGFKYDINDSNNFIRTHAKAFNVHDRFQIVGGVDPELSNRKLFNEIFGVRIFENITQALGEVQADVIVIASPTEYHLDNIIEVLANSRPKVILLEKPVAYTKKSSNRILEFSEKYSVPILINFIRRTDPSFQQVKSKIDSGLIKIPCKGVVWYSKGLIHNACHFIDLLSWWLGDIEAIDLIDTGRQINEWDYEPDLRIKFGGSEIFFLAKKQEEFIYYSIDLLMANGRLYFSCSNEPIIWQNKSDNDIGLDSYCLKIDNELDQYQYNVANDISMFLDKKESYLPMLI